MTRYDIMPVQRWHAYYIARYMREADRMEVWASNQLVPREAIFKSLEVSHVRKATGTADGVPICIFGIGQPTILSDEGSPWMLATDGLAQHAKPFLQLSRRWMADVQKDYRLLANFVDARNTKSIKWLRWLGFTIGREPRMMNGQAFFPFAWSRPDVRTDNRNSRHSLDCRHSAGDWGISLRPDAAEQGRRRAG